MRSSEMFNKVNFRYEAGAS